MQIEAGKFYVDRIGRQHGPIRSSSRADGAVFTDGKHFWHDDGRWSHDFECALDLVSVCDACHEAVHGRGR